MKMILGLPRSRTAWLAAWLSDHDGVCTHEGLAQCESIHEYINQYGGEYFADSTTAFDYVGAVRADRVIILRDPRECHESTFQFLGFDIGVDWFEQRFDILSSIDGLKIDFDDLNDSLPLIWEAMKGTDYSSARADVFKGLNIQTSNKYYTDSPFVKNFRGDTCH